MRNKTYCANRGSGYCGECVEDDLLEKLDTAESEAKKSYAKGRREAFEEAAKIAKASCWSCNQNGRPLYDCPCGPIRRNIKAKAKEGK